MNAADAEALWRELVREIPDFPVAGIGFKDITPVLAHPGAFRACADALAERFADAGVEEIIFAPLRGAETVQRVDEEIISAFD